MHTTTAGIYLPIIIESKVVCGNPDLCDFSCLFSAFLRIKRLYLDLLFFTLTLFLGCESGFVRFGFVLTENFRLRLVTPEQNKVLLVN